MAQLCSVTAASTGACGGVRARAPVQQELSARSIAGQGKQT